ncbi:uncharacterized protein EI90DRAFT_2244009 [Cantharellus anzutake]|uniref:uncharacterized protein n=1 Tax=Cantharellus anzutake TaxID=1750568 RepID=UPI0019078FD7|nr:uncharacterized protein EI90DRAFT_2244009 [Cantharellus anzutake]KAF8324730.1 hypothetical protein EI90DRAFT_2244009 [Cantharellus anzutake]
MRFWSLFSLIAVLPIVAADFHVGSARCTQSFPHTAGAEAIWGVIIPSNQDGCIGATTLYFGQGIQYGPGMTTKVCGATITISGNQTWRSSDGKYGPCYWLNGVVGAVTGCSSAPYETCVWTDYMWCQSDLCK